MGAEPGAETSKVPEEKSAGFPKLAANKQKEARTESNADDIC